MARSVVEVASLTRSRKETVAEMNNLALIVPAMKTVSSAGTVVNDAGIPTPDAAVAADVAGAGTGLTGVYLYAVCFYDQTYDQEGAPSSTDSVTLANQNASLTFASITNEASNSRVGFFNIYRSLAGGSVLFYVGTTSTVATSYVDAATDASISANDTLRVGDQAKYPPSANTYGFAVAHGSRIFLGGPADFYDYDSAYAHRVGWSDSGSADAFQTGNYVLIGKGDSGGPIRSAAAQGESLVVYKERGIWLWMYRDDPSGATGDGSLQKVVNDRGTLNFKTVVNVDGMHIVMDDRGWYVYRGGQSILDISDSIKPLLRRINWAAKAVFSAAYDEQRVYFFVALDDDEECNYAVVLDLDAFRSGVGVRWWLYHYPHGIRDCTTFIMGNTTNDIAYGMSGRRYVAVMTRYGTMYALGNSLYDTIRDAVEMRKTGTTPGVGGGGATDTTTFYVEGTVHTHSGIYVSLEPPIAKQRVFGVGMDGSQRLFPEAPGMYLKVYHDHVTEQRLIVDHSTGGVYSATHDYQMLILESSITTTLAAGTAVAIGVIDASYNTALMDFGDTANPKYACGVDIEYESRPIDFDIDVAFTVDRDFPVVYGYTQSNTEWTATASADEVTVHMGAALGARGSRGFVTIPVGGPDFTYIQGKVRSTSVDAPFEIASLSFVPKKRGMSR